MFASYLDNSIWTLHSKRVWWTLFYWLSDILQEYFDWQVQKSPCIKKNCQQSLDWHWQKTICERICENCLLRAEKIGVFVVADKRHCLRFINTAHLFHIYVPPELLIIAHLLSEAAWHLAVSLSVYLSPLSSLPPLLFSPLSLFPTLISFMSHLQVCAAEDSSNYSKTTHIKRHGWFC